MPSASFRRPRGAGISFRLANSLPRACHVTALAEPHAETGVGEWLAIFGDEVGQVRLLLGIASIAACNSGIIIWSFGGICGKRRLGQRGKPSAMGLI